MAHRRDDDVDWAPDDLIIEENLEPLMPVPRFMPGNCRKYNQRKTSTKKNYTNLST